MDGGVSWGCEAAKGWGAAVEEGGEARGDEAEDDRQLDAEPVAWDFAMSVAEAGGFGFLSSLVVVTFWCDGNGEVKVESWKIYAHKRQESRLHFELGIILQHQKSTNLPNPNHKNKAAIQNSQ